MKKTILLALLVLLGVGFINAQTRVTGKVTSAEDGQPLPYVTIVVKGTNTLATSGVDGKYSVTLPEGHDVLTFSFSGMQIEDVTVGGRAIIDIAMITEVAEIETALIVGYGVSTKKSFTGSATTLSGGAISNKTDANPIKALDGTVPGVNLTISSGQPGAPTTMFIRGRNSVNSGTQPLYVIDGVIMSSTTMGVRSSSGVEFSPLATLNSNDIENITILKDATATSIYGAQAANGVILITTKSGHRGKPKVNLQAKWGFETLPSYTSRYKILNQDQYVELMTEGLQNGFGWSHQDATDVLFDEFDLPAGKRIDTDWVDEVMRNGFIQEYNVSVQGGGGDATSPTYFLSLGYLDNEGIIIGKDITRYSFRLNLNHAPSKIVSYGVNTSLSHTTTNLGTGGGYFSDPLTQAYMQSPLSPVRLSSGAWNFDTPNKYNPVAQRSEYGDVNESKVVRAIISPHVRINLLDGVSFMSRAGIDYIHQNEFMTWSFLQPQGKGMNGMGENATFDRTLLSWTNTINWIKTFNDVHNLNLLVGQELQHTNDFETYLAGKDYPVEFLNSISLTASPASASTAVADQALASYFFNAQYDYANKYYISGSLRTDGSSRFGSNNRWGTFYSVGLRYRLSEEAFMESTKAWLSNLSLRSSYGTSGNQTVGGSWYPAYGLFSFGGDYNQSPGFYQSQIKNPDLKWEQTAKFNVGLDLGFFKNRLIVEFDYYIHNTKDMVFNVPISITTGLVTSTTIQSQQLPAIAKNLGKLENKGVEFTVRGIILNKKNLRWTSTFVGSHNKNTIKKLATDHPIEYTLTMVEAGRDYYTFRMREYAGVDPQTGMPLWYKDETGDETTKNYNEASKRYVGSASPDFTGSFTNMWEFYGFDLSVQLNLSLGSKIYADHLRYDEQSGANLNNTTRYIYDNRWQKPGDITDVPKFVYGGAGNANQGSTRFLMDGDYLKIRNITLGYTLPSRITSKLNLSSIRLFATADNVHTFTKSNYRGFDPSGIAASGVQWWNYPLSGNYMFGINVGF